MVSQCIWNKIQIFALACEALNALGPVYFSNSVMSHTSPLLLCIIFSVPKALLSLMPVHQLTSKPWVPVNPFFELWSSSHSDFRSQITDLRSQTPSFDLLTPNTVQCSHSMKLHCLFMCFLLMSLTSSKLHEGRDFLIHLVYCNVSGVQHMSDIQKSLNKHSEQ